MKTKIAAAVVGLVVAVGAMLLTRGGLEPENTAPPTKYWAGEYCPITGKCMTTPIPMMRWQGIYR